MRTDLIKGILIGAPLGWATGLALYGGIGYLVAGQTGLIIGAAIATAFAAAGLTLCLRFVQQAPLESEAPF